MVIGLGRYAQYGRIGAFLAGNNGTVEGCVSDVTFPKKLKSADFVYENNAKIANSISIRGMRKKQTRTFYALNTGSITTSGNVAAAGTQTGERRSGGDPVKARNSGGAHRLRRDVRRIFRQSDGREAGISGAADSDWHCG